MSTRTGIPSGHPSEHFQISDDDPTDPNSSGTQIPNGPRRGRPKADSPTTVKRSRVKREVPAGVPIPRKGIARILYKIYVLVGRPDKVPSPGKREQFELLVEGLEERLRFLVNHMQITISFVNGKGGASKTTIAVHVGSIISNLTRKTVYVIPATQATATATLALNAGIELGATLTVSGFARVLTQYPTYREQSAQIPPTKFGLRVLSEESDEDVSIEREFNIGNFIGVVDALHPNVDAMLFDTGNDDVKVGSVPLEAVRRSDVVVYTATADKPMTLEKLSSTIATYLTDLRNPQNVSLEPGTQRSEVQIPTREKTSNSLAVVSGVRRKEDPESYQKYTQLRDSSGQVIGGIGFEGTFHTIPWDAYMSEHIVSDITKIDKTTYLALLQLCVLMYEKAAQLRGIKVNALGRHAAPPTAEADWSQQTDVSANLRSTESNPAPTVEGR